MSRNIKLDKVKKVALRIFKSESRNLQKKIKLNNSLKGGYTEKPGEYLWCPGFDSIGKTR